MKTIFLFSGKAQSGKDYVSNKLKESLESKGFKVKKLAFADLLKDYLSTLLNISVEELERMKLEEKPFTANGLSIRQLMQRMGTELFREKIDDMYWVRQTGKIIGTTDYDYYIISDRRFPNEFNVINYACENDKRNTYSIVTVRMLNNDVIESSNHISENLLDSADSDITIDNTNHSYIFNEKDFLKKGQEYAFDLRWVNVL